MTLKNCGQKLRALSIAALMLCMAPLTALADSGFYIGGSIGSSSLEADLSDITLPGVPSELDEDEAGYKVFAGFNADLPVLDLGIEAGYVDFGEPEIDVLGEDLTLELTGFNIWGIASLDVGPFDIYGKLGYVIWDVEAELAGESESDDGSDLGYGLGLRFNLGALEIRGEYEIYDLDETDLDMLSVGIAYHFD